MSFIKNLILNWQMPHNSSQKKQELWSHETHRGRLGYSPQSTWPVFDMREQFCMPADLSHWVCVTESMLDNIAATFDEAIKRSRHIHVRIRFE